MSSSRESGTGKPQEQAADPPRFDHRILPASKVGLKDVKMPRGRQIDGGPNTKSKFGSRVRHDP